MNVWGWEGLQWVDMEKVSNEELDRLLLAMVKSAEGISDLLFVAGKPPQIEVHGALGAKIAL